MPKKAIKIVKIPREANIVDYPQVFPRMPRLYLELIENKAKIKQDLINQYYKPTPLQVVETKNTQLLDEKYEKTRQLESRLEKLLNEQKEPEPNNDPTPEPVKKPSEKRQAKKKEKKVTPELEFLDEPEETPENDIAKEPDTDYIQETMSVPAHSDTEDQLEKELPKDFTPQDKNEDIKVETPVKDDYSSDGEDELDKHINDVLGKDNGSVSSKYSVKRKDKYSRIKDYRHRSVNQPSRPPVGLPPTLEELEKTGTYTRKEELRDINYIAPSELEDEDAKRELIFKFDLLRDSYKGANIPEFTIHSDYKTMKHTYNATVRKLSIGSAVEDYKKYLMMGCLVLEFVLGNFFKFDMSGFTQQQVLSMNSYEKLLIELGEKSYMPTGAKWPVELRLLIMIVINAAIFIVTKMILKKTGANLLGMINGMTANTQTHASEPEKKRKMKGPSIDINNLPEQ